MKPYEFVRLLDLGPAHGDENRDNWPTDVANEWSWVRRSMQRYGDGMLLRWATINGDDMWITGFHGETFTAPAIDEDEGGYPEPLEEIARCWWSVENTGAPISWAGGYILERVAPELACSRPYNDEVEIAEDGAYQFIDLPAEPSKSFAEAVAQWIVDHDAEVGAALSFEEFDPDNTLDDDERQAWQNAMYDIELGANVCDQEDLVKESLTRLSSLYRDARDAIANPTGELGERLLAAYGDLPEITSGSWASGD